MIRAAEHLMPADKAAPEDGDKPYAVFADRRRNTDG
jgi:hypothetical protein